MAARRKPSAERRARRRRPAGARGRLARSGRVVRYAVVGLGHIAQDAVLPAFEHAGENSRLAALVSDDPVKLRALGRRYDVKNLFSYEDYDACLNSGLVDAVYIALPNSLHAEYGRRAAQAGIHVLCEKPLAVTEEDCQSMIEAARAEKVKLMTAYRLHFESANMEAVELVRSGKLGKPRFFESAFSMQARPDDIRLRTATGGGTLYDLGIYCINAARYIFEDEPSEVFGWSVSSRDPRFREVDETTSALLRFPGERMAMFTSSFGACDVSSFRVVGTEGELRCEPAYEYLGDLKHYLTVDGKQSERTFAARDQFAPELVYFSDCVLENVEPEPSGIEGLADVRVVRAIYRSAAEGRPVKLEWFEKARRPGPEQEMRRPRVRRPELVHARPPSL